MADRPTGLSPADTPAGAATRFLVGLAAWVLGAWAAWDVGGPVLGLVVLVVVAAVAGRRRSAWLLGKDPLGA